MNVGELWQGKDDNIFKDAFFIVLKLENIDVEDYGVRVKIYQSRRGDTSWWWRSNLERWATRVV